MLQQSSTRNTTAHSVCVCVCILPSRSTAGFSIHDPFPSPTSECQTGTPTSPSPLLPPRQTMERIEGWQKKRQKKRKPVQFPVQVTKSQKARVAPSHPPFPPILRPPPRGRPHPRRLPAPNTGVPQKSQHSLCGAPLPQLPSAGAFGCLHPQSLATRSHNLRIWGAQTLHSTRR